MDDRAIAAIAAGPPRAPAVAGLFYPSAPGALHGLVDQLVAEAAGRWPAPPAASGPLAGILVPHAGLAYSGLVAAAAWRLLPAATGGQRPTVVLLGTNHGAGWLRGVGSWAGGRWRTPLGDLEVDADLAGAVLDLGAPFGVDSRCHLGEHSIEVQLPFIRRLAPDARIVPLSVAAGRGAGAIEAGERLGRLLAERRGAGAAVLLAISTDMAHYPPAQLAERVTTDLIPSIVDLAPAELAAAEVAAVRREPRIDCGMCGIEPAVLGLAALRAMAAMPGVVLAAATSADAGGDPGRTVGYLSVAFPEG